jgi:trimeric autotransporter adhesin
MNKKEILLVVGALVVGLFVGRVVLMPSLGGVYNSPTGVYTGDLTGDVTGNITGNVTGNLTGAVVGTTITASGETNLDSLIQGGDVTAITTSSAAYTLTAANICDSSILNISPLGAELTVTLPSTTTLFADCLTANGDVKEIGLSINTTSTVFAVPAGNGIAASASTTFAGDTSGTMRVVRFSDTVMSALLINMAN